MQAVIVAKVLVLYSVDVLSSKVKSAGFIWDSRL